PGLGADAAPRSAADRDASASWRSICRLPCRSSAALPLEDRSPCGFACATCERYVTLVRVVNIYVMKYWLRWLQGATFVLRNSTPRADHQTVSWPEGAKNGKAAASPRACARSSRPMGARARWPK